MNKKRWKFHALLALFLAMGLLAGCDGGDDDDDDDNGQEGNPLLSAFHAVADMGTITIVTGDGDEEAVWQHLDFTEQVNASVNTGTIDFHFETALPGDDISVCAGDADDDGIKDDNECTRFAFGSVDAKEDTEHMVILYGHHGASGSLDNLEVLQYEKARHEFDTEDEDENMEVWFFHLTEGLGEVDVYLEEPGTNLSPVQVRGTIGLKDAFNGLVDEGSYVLTLTEPAQPDQVRFISESFKLNKQTRVAFAIREGAGEGTSAVIVTQFRDRNNTLLDRDRTTELRVAHAVPGGGNIDVFAGNDFSAPFVTDLPFGGQSAYSEIAPGDLRDLSMDATPPGDPGVFLAREELDLNQGEKAAFYFLGEEDRWRGLRVSDDVRHFATHARLRVINGARSSLDYYIVDQENDNISSLPPNFSLSFRANSGWQTFEPGIYKVVVTQQGSSTIAYSDTVELSAGGIYGAVSTINTTDPSAADMVYMDDFMEN